jgi:hypothetical protein
MIILDVAGLTMLFDQLANALRCTSKLVRDLPQRRTSHSHPNSFMALRNR